MSCDLDTQLAALSFGAEKRSLPTCSAEDLFSQETGCEDWLDVVVDVIKDERRQEDHCAGCGRSRVPLVGCAAADCYAAYCNLCNARAQGRFYKHLFMCGMCMKDAEDVVGSDAYEDTDRSSEVEKVDSNIEFVALAASLGAERVLVLDGRQCQTTKALRRWNPDVTVFVPNPSRCTCVALKEAGATTYPVRVGGFLTRTRRNDACKVNAAWLDYTGTYCGSKVQCSFPRQDLRKLWEHGFRDGEVGLVLTVSQRNACRDADTLRLRTPQEIVEEQITTAARFGWHIHPGTDIKEYGHNMLQLTMRASMRGELGAQPHKKPRESTPTSTPQAVFFSTNTSGWEDALIRGWITGKDGSGVTVTSTEDLNDEADPGGWRPTKIYTGITFRKVVNPTGNDVPMLYCTRDYVVYWKVSGLTNTHILFDKHSRVRRGEYTFALFEGHV